MARRVCITMTDNSFRDNEASLGGAVFWKYVYNGTGFPILDCDNCDTGATGTSSGKNDIATDAIGIALGYFPNGEVFESGAKLEDRSGVDPMLVGHSYIRTMRCDRLAVAMPALSAMVMEYCVLEGYTRLQCDVLQQSVVPAYPREVCTYFGWLPEGDVGRAEADVLRTHDTNVNDGCQLLRDELLFGGKECDQFCDIVHNRLHNIVSDQDAAAAAAAAAAGSERTVEDPIAFNVEGTSHDDATDQSATGLDKYNKPIRNPVANVTTVMSQLSRPLDTLCGIEREAIINERGERLVSITSRRCEMAKTLHERCVVQAHGAPGQPGVPVGVLMEQAVAKCTRVYDTMCPKICRKSERLTCQELSHQLAGLATASASASASATVNDFQHMSLSSSRIDYNLPLGPYIKAVDYYGNPVTIDTTTSCSVIRRQVDPALLEQLRVDHLEAVALADEKAYVFMDTCWWYMLVVHVGGTCWWYMLVVHVVFLPVYQKAQRRDHFESSTHRKNMVV